MSSLPDQIYAPSRGRAVRELIETVIIAVALALFVRGFVVESFLVQGTSMEPTLHHSDRLLVYKLGYRLGEPKAGDVIVFRYPLDPERDFIKRVIATSGDRIRIQEGIVYVNGEPLNESYLRNRDSSNMPERVVPPGSVFVMGDNRTNSEDSREFGFVDRSLIIGRAILVYWPPDGLRLIE